MNTTSRRSFLKTMGSFGALSLNQSTQAERVTRPNLLVILVDQMRYPAWFPSEEELVNYLPNISRLRKSGVSFSQHYNTATACTPSRASLLTGLYAHQHYCLKTSTIDRIPFNRQFPTWGTLLRQLGLGYQTWWFGKWHLAPAQLPSLEGYGFSGGTYPSPNGGKNEGLREDPKITQQFLDWLAYAPSNQPWCTTVSLINPHDISKYPDSLDQTEVMINKNLRTQGHNWLAKLPDNYESAEQLRAHKPTLQSWFLEQTDARRATLPHGEPGTDDQPWLTLLTTYLQLQQCLDQQVGDILDGLAARPEVAANTVIIFTSDHGDYGGSHGIHTKGGAAYDESIRIPLYVHDLTGQWVKQPGTERTQLTSSVDIAPLLLTLASGNRFWQWQPGYLHLTNRLDLAALLSNPTAQGRPYILTTYDEASPQDVLFEGKSIPSHVVGLRRSDAKLVLYSFWAPGTVAINPTGHQTECYDYSQDQLEVENVAETNPELSAQLYQELALAIATELRAPLPRQLQAAQQQSIASYLMS